MLRTKMATVAAMMIAAVALGGCAGELEKFKTTIGNAASVVETAVSATVSPNAIVLAASSYDALEATAKNYIDPRLNKRCNGTNGPVCRDPNATIVINKAMREGRVARNNAKQFLRDHPGELGTEGLYDALQLAIGTLQSIFTQYNIGTK
jgi:hypothetical protein